jgi:hypothetical protein
MREENSNQRGDRRRGESKATLHGKVSSRVPLLRHSFFVIPSEVEGPLILPFLSCDFLTNAREGQRSLDKLGMTIKKKRNAAEHWVALPHC